MILQSGPSVVPSTHGLLTTLAFEHLQPFYALEGSVASAGSAISWLRQIGLIDEAAQVDIRANEVANSGGVTFVPCLGGLLAPHWRPDARGTLLGLSQHTQR